MKNQLPNEVLAAARIVEQWAAKNNIRSWKIGALASRDQTERDAARYAVARELGTEVWAERWGGMRRSIVTGSDYDAVIDRRISASNLSLGEAINVAVAIQSGSEKESVSE